MQKSFEIEILVYPPSFGPWSWKQCIRITGLKKKTIRNKDKNGFPKNDNSYLIWNASMVIIKRGCSSNPSLLYVVCKT